MNGANFTAEELIQAINDSLNQPKRPLRIEYNQGDILNAIEVGKLLANQRTIKLLKEELCSCVLAECLIAQAIALIKGEQK